MHTELSIFSLSNIGRTKLQKMNVDMSYLLLLPVRMCSLYCFTNKRQYNLINYFELIKDEKNLNFYRNYVTSL